MKNISKSLILLGFTFVFGCYLPENVPPDQNESAEMENTINYQNILKDIRHLSLKIGPRPAGSVKANEAAEWFKKRLQEVNCSPQSHVFKLPDGKFGHNILCQLKGQTPQVIVVAAHLDTVEQSPGANDDASGLAVLI